MYAIFSLIKKKISEKMANKKASFKVQNSKNSI